MDEQEIKAYLNYEDVQKELETAKEIIKKLLPAAYRAKSGLWANDPYCGYVDEIIQQAKQFLQ